MRNALENQDIEVVAINEWVHLLFSKNPSDFRSQPLHRVRLHGQ
jgi:hypothetical protein